ncbi:protein yellow-like [Halictus rubicundus]|uniref:protein yellow-like n=1 Tax=Halictus rubicundus TaxID=77578 RepID=UPI004036C499
MKIYWRLLCVSLLCLGAGRVEGLQRWGSQFGKAPLLERFFWKTLDFAYPDEASRQMAMMRGDFVPENALPVGIEIWRNKLFVTVPRWRNGIPATLNYISLDTNRGGSPRLTPYPNWAQNKAGACGTGMTTAYRIHADACDRLWVLDTGTIGIGNTTVQACPYTLNVFDLTTDKILRQYRLRPEDINMIGMGQDGPSMLLGGNGMALRPGTSSVPQWSIQARGSSWPTCPAETLPTPGCRSAVDGLPSPAGHCLRRTRCRRHRICDGEPLRQGGIGLPHPTPVAATPYERDTEQERFHTLRWST